jgi:hypothetical protein
MAGYDGAGSLFALGLRLTKLDAAGAPLVGLENCYVTEALVTIGMGNTYSEPDPIELCNGQGIVCVYYAALADPARRHDRGGAGVHAGPVHSAGLLRRRPDHGRPQTRSATGAPR